MSVRISRQHWNALLEALDGARQQRHVLTLPRTGFFEHALRLGRFSGAPDGMAAASWHSAEIVRVFEYSYPEED